MDVFEWANLLARPVARALVASVFICGLGVALPQTMFWGEFEFQAIATLAPNTELNHVWPKAGMFDFQPSGFASSLALGVAKLIAVSFTVAGGYRGGFIFPFFAAGAAFGRAMTFLFPSIPPQISCLCFAAGINVAITRTALATSLILATLAGEINAGPPVLAASLVSLFATAYMVRAVASPEMTGCRFFLISLPSLSHVEFLTRFFCFTNMSTLYFHLLVGQPFIRTQTSRHDVHDSQLFSLTEESLCILLRDEITTEDECESTPENSSNEYI
jgi:hypothetical protein